MNSSSSETSPPEASKEFLCKGCCLLKKWGNYSACLLAVALLLWVVGCTSSKRISVENDKLRASNLEFKREVQRLHASVKAKADQLQALETSTTPPADPGAQIPRLNKVEFGRYCTAIDQDGDGHDDLIRLYVLTLDYQKRFIPVAGKAIAQVDHLVAGQEPIKIASQAFGVKSFDQAYRSGITGSHYTLDIPLPKKVALQNATSVTVSLSLTDVQYGKTFNQQIVLPLQP